MRLNDSCEDCLLGRYSAAADVLEDAKERQAYIEEITDIVRNRSEMASAPYLIYHINEAKKRHGVPLESYAKEMYNQVILEREEEIEKNINASADPLYTALLYARIGNYIDFGATNTVQEDVLMKLIDEAEDQMLEEEVYREFVWDCESGKRFLLLCDNCGEIVFDKFVVRQMKKRFPHLKIYVMVRGGDVLNDATMEDAVFCGMDREAELITNGGPVSGTVRELMSAEAKEVLDSADVVLSKGQGNYEGLSGCDRRVYYLFLCKCQLFISRFGVPKYTGMFIRE